jgi:hypothetical protein
LVAGRRRGLASNGGQEVGPAAQKARVAVLHLRRVPVLVEVVPGFDRGKDMRGGGGTPRK